MPDTSDTQTQEAIRQPLLNGADRVRLLTGFVAALAVALTASLASWQPLPSPIALRWWALMPLFYVAEIAVVHIRFRREAHSMSLNEIPLVLGLFFTAPAELVVAQVAGALLVLTIHRRQPPIKLAFNVSQFALSAAASVIVFRMIVSLGDPLSALGAVAAIVAVLVPLPMVAALISRVIQLMGGPIDPAEARNLLLLSSVGYTINAVLGLIAVHLIWLNPGSAWLAVLPPVIVFLAYRSYVAQMSERARMTALYEATLDLHSTPQIDDALVTAATHACSMIDAEFADIVLFPNGTNALAYVTAVGPNDRCESMRPALIRPEESVYRTAIEGGESVRFTEPNDGPTSATPPVDNGIAVPLIDRTGGVIGLVVAANRLGDISSFGRDDEELLATLASRIAVTLENGELKDSLAEVTELKEQLEQAARSKDQFIASISHELRTPLTAVVGLAHELTGGNSFISPDEAVELVALIADQSAELSYIVEDLLVAARADIGTLNLKSERVDLTAAIEAVIAGHLSSSDATQINISRAPWSSYCRADGFRVRQILRNLVTNATRYGGNEIWMDVDQREASVVITVADNGPGIPAGNEELIFEPYGRVEAAKAEPASVGLGLAVARQLAQLMDGELEYVRVGDHTEFRLTLPANELTTAVAASSRSTNGEAAISLAVAAS
jgi:signal transduction histidine kinase